MTPSEMQMEVEPHLVKIGLILGGNYRLTLLARWVGEKPLDADIVLTVDNLEAASKAIKKRADALTVKLHPRNDKDQATAK